MCRFGFGAGGTRGVPFNEITQRNMPEIKQAFIDLFLRKAKSEMEAAKTQGVPQPYAPSPELTLLYSKAVRRYDARRFTQVQDVERIFDFLEVEEGAEA